MKLKPFEEHWQEKEQHYFKDWSNQPSGVACPDCGTELRKNEAAVLTSIPPKRPAWCENCGWQGYL